MYTAPTASTDPLMRLPAVLAVTGYSRSGLYLAMQECSFPRPVKIGRLSAWPESEVRQWIEGRKAARAAT
ncbi:AlpA family transcriptional regulator [Maritimibacter fusiformis]|uniref:AlpA family transcriptional regulator n=2 Tax=Maritimibacter fusiformis TaxID=2603819 RepID=A0A5D0RLU3_9RHOB|nr:AlpA family transcriptional regulator [Maritimibacter fusiformis]